MKKNNKPKHFGVLKIIGFIGIIAAIIGFILSFTGMGDFTTNNFMIGGTLVCLGIFVGGTCLSLGFQPEMTKLNTKGEKYIQEQNKEDLTDIANDAADIKAEAITKTVRAIKKGLDDTMFCKHCGAEIDADSKFCSKCGKEQ